MVGGEWTRDLTMVLRHRYLHLRHLRYLRETRSVPKIVLRTYLVVGFGGLETQAGPHGPGIAVGNRKNPLRSRRHSAQRAESKRFTL